MTRDILVYSDDALIGEVNVPEGEPAWFEYSHSWLEKHVKTVSSSRKVHLKLSSVLNRILPSLLSLFSL